ncbi:MAG: tetratricopeptide repeat protein [Bacteroidota bacterium]
MKYHIIIALLLASLVQVTLSAQTRRMNNVATGRTFAAENPGRSVIPLLQEAERQFRALNYEGTFFTLENAVAQNPQSAEALILRAKFKKMTGMQTEAEADLRLANQINPMAADLYGYNGNAGILKLLSIEPEEAVTSLSTFQKLNYYYQSIDRKITNGDLSEEESAVLLEVVEKIEGNNLYEALDDINTALEDFPKSALAYDLKGVILKKQGKFEDALDAFNKAIELDPKFGIAWYNLGLMEQSLGNYEKAKEHLDRSIELQKDLTKAYFDRAVLLKKMGKEKNALKDYNSVINEKGTSYMEAYLNRGLTRKMLGDYTGALADLNRVIKELPEDAELRKNRGNLHLLFGLNRKAIDDYTRAIELDGNYAEAYYNRALAFFLIYDKISGCADLDSSIDLGYEKAVQTKSYFCTY